MSIRKKKFVVFSILDKKSSPIVFATLAESHDVACHYGEIAHGWGNFIALNKNQARKVSKKLKAYLQNW